MFSKQVVVKTAAFEIFGTVEKQGIFGEVLLFKYVLNKLIDGLCRISDGRSFHSLI